MSDELPGMQAIVTYHVEGERETPSAAVFAEIERQVRLADELGYHAAWFAEHHFHVHRGHLPNPTLFALHLAGRTRRICLGSAVLCTGLHHPLRLAEDLLVADVLSGGRLSVGLGSGSTPPEFAAFGLPATEQTPEARHRRFAEQLDLLEQAWSGGPIAVHGQYVDVEAPPLLPRAIRPLQDLLWIAANSPAQAQLAGRRGYGLMLSRERTLPELEQLVAAFRSGRAEAGLSADGGRIAASRAIFVGETDAQARAAAESAVWALVERQRRERPQAAALALPASFEEACERTLFVVGGPEMAIARLKALRAVVPFTAFHIQPRWPGLRVEDVEASIARFAQVVAPALS